MATKKTTSEGPIASGGAAEPQAQEAPLKLKEETQKSVEEAEAAAETSGTPSPTREPDKVKTPIPGTTGDLDVVSTDDATSLNPNVVVSGTKPDGRGGQQLLDVVDPAVANAALLPRGVAVTPENPSTAPEQSGAPLSEGQVRFKVTADNEPFASTGPLKKGETVTLSREEAELLVQLKAGTIEGGSQSASDENAKPEGAEAE
jgi:hypothetical protein